MSREIGKILSIVIISRTYARTFVCYLKINCAFFLTATSLFTSFLFPLKNFIADAKSLNYCVTNRESNFQQLLTVEFIAVFKKLTACFIRFIIYCCFSPVEKLVGGLFCDFIYFMTFDFLILNTMLFYGMFDLNW